MRSVAFLGGDWMRKVSFVKLSVFLKRARSECGKTNLSILTCDEGCRRAAGGLHEPRLMMGESAIGLTLLRNSRESAQKGLQWRSLAFE